MIPYGSLVVYVTPNKDRRYIKRLEEGQDWHSNDGVLSAEAVHAAKCAPVWISPSVCWKPPCTTVSRA